MFVVALDAFGGFAGFLPDRDDPATANAARRPKLFPPGLELFEHGEILAEAVCWTRTQSILGEAQAGRQLQRGLPPVLYPYE